MGQHKLRGPQRGVYCDLHVALDISARSFGGWALAAREDAGMATELLTEAVKVPGKPESVDADPARR
ncbi:MAG: hypothetical protein M3Q22_00335 [Actinomycetota bacterium]|nr:hypothetical protein [Actinomycetota bacterium]